MTEFCAYVAQLVEHILGKDEVTSSSLVSSSIKTHEKFVGFSFRPTILSLIRAIRESPLQQTPLFASQTKLRVCYHRRCMLSVKDGM